MRLFVAVSQQVSRPTISGHRNCTEVWCFRLLQPTCPEETEAALQALSNLPDTPYRQALINLTQLALHRIQ